MTQMGFNLSVTPEVMRAIVVKTILEQDPLVECGVLGFADDLLVDESVVDAEYVIDLFNRFGLECKPPPRASS